MFKLELREGAGVFTPGDKQVGKVNGFVLDPSTNEVTHLVVQKGWLFPEDKVVPFDMVSSTTEDKVVLNKEIEDINELTPFEESHFIRAHDADVSRGGNPRTQMDDRGGMSTFDEINRDPIIEADVSRGGVPRSGPIPAYLWYPPHGYVGYPVGYYGWPPMEKTRNIPEGTIPVKEGTNVISADGEHVGDVERLFVEPDTNRATHFAISQGLLFKDRKLVPAHWVKSVDEDKVHLKVSSEVLEGLPSYED
jgi:uncharacterized protein YrrD